MRVSQQGQSERTLLPGHVRTNYGNVKVEVCVFKLSVVGVWGSETMDGVRTSLLIMLEGVLTVLREDTGRVCLGKPRFFLRVDMGPRHNQQ